MSHPDLMLDGLYTQIAKLQTKYKVRRSLIKEKSDEDDDAWDIHGRYWLDMFIADLKELE